MQNTSMLIFLLVLKFSIDHLILLNATIYAARLELKRSTIISEDIAH